MICDLIIKMLYNFGEWLLLECEIVEMFDVMWMVVCEVLIMLEIKGLVEVCWGVGIYVFDNLGSQNIDSLDVNVCNDVGFFELLQVWQLLESNIVEFVVLQVICEDIVKMCQVL